MQAIALYSCKADEANDLEFEKGDELIEVIKAGEGWLTATSKRTGLRGLVPENYVKFKPAVPSRAASNSVLIPSSTSTSRENSITPATSVTSAKQVAPYFMQEKDFNKYVDFFVKEDTDNDGFLSPAEVKKVYSLSNQQKEFLAQVWALVDINKKGKLSGGEFILGMWLISQKVRDPNRYQLPFSLDPNFINWKNDYDNALKSNNSNAAKKSLISKSNSDLDLSSSSFSSSFNYSTSSPAQKTNKNGSAAPKAVAAAQGSGELADRGEKISSFDMYKFSRTDQGKEFVSAGSDFAKSDAGKAAGKVAYENRETIVKAAQSEQGKKAISAAWANRNEVASLATAGMKAASKAEK